MPPLTNEEMVAVVECVNDGSIPPLPESEIMVIAEAYADDPLHNKWGIVGTVVAMCVDKVRGERHKLKEAKDHEPS